MAPKKQSDHVNPMSNYGTTNWTRFVRIQTVCHTTQVATPYTHIFLYFLWYLKSMMSMQYGFCHVSQMKEILILNQRQGSLPSHKSHQAVQHTIWKQLREQLVQQTVQENVG